jgi:1-deoxy-D-xylulose 5-phosphate reductoisomerase
MKIPIANSMNSSSFFKNNNKFIFNNKYSQKFNFYIAKEIMFPSIKILTMNEVLNETGYIVINSLNEILVDSFLKKKILFPDITHKLLSILKSKIVRNYLKNNKIRHITDVFKTYNFCKKLLTE